MRKNLLAAITTLFILSSVLVSFGNKAFAVDANDVFHVNNDHIGTDSISITNSATYDDGAKLFLRIQIHGDGGNNPVPAHDAQTTGVTGNGSVDWADLETNINKPGQPNTDWDSVYDSEMEESSETGLFLQIGTSKSADGKNIENEVTYDILGLPANQQPVKTANGPGDNKARQIGGVLWRIGDPNVYFFDKDTFTPSVIVTGLQSGTTYYARIIVEEDGSNDTFLTDPIVEFTTKTGEGTVTGLGVEAVPPTTPPTQSSGGIDLGTCFSFSDGLDFPACMLILFNELFVGPSAWLAQTTGRLFDAFAAVSLGSAIYGGPGGANDIGGFIDSGWSTVRDIANIFFIFLLLYTALSLVLSLHGFDAKKMIAKIIIISILINFSLFFCHLAIDASNILSRVFYNSMNISTVGNEPTVTVTGIDEKSISAAIVEGVQPQTILGSESFKKLQEAGPSKGMVFIVLLMSFIINIAFAWMFFMCAAFFAGRIGMIWISMIFVPLAFVTSIVPALDKSFKQLGWSSWLSNFLSACFKAPIFFFFMYLIVKLTGGDGVMQAVIHSMATGTSFPAFIVTILLPMMILIGLIREAKSIAEQMAGEFGAAFTGVIAAGVGLAAIAATGGAAAIGRGVGSTVKLAGNDAAQKDLRDKMKTKSYFNPTKYTDMARLGATKAPGIQNIANRANKAQEKSDNITHAKHELQDYTTKKFGKDKKYEDLTLTQRNQVLQNIDRDKVGQDLHGKDYKNLDETQKKAVDKKIKDTSDADRAADIAAGRAVGTTNSSHSNHLHQESKLKMKNRENLAMAVRSGTYDVRNLANIKGGKGVAGGIGVFATAKLAQAIRAGFQGVNIDLKQSDKTMGTDFGSMFAHLLSSVKAAGVKPPSSGHDPHANDAHGGGDHGGDHH